MNENGRRLQPQVISILRQVRELEAKSSGGNQAGAVRIAATSTIGNYLMPKISSNFMADHPNAMVKLMIMSEPEIIEQVEAMHVDLGFIEGVTMRHTLAAESWFEDELVLVAGADHWGCGKSLKPDDLMRERWILHPIGSFARHSFVGPYAALIRSGAIVCESNSVESIKRTVQEGVGISCLSRFTITGELARDDLIELKVEGFPMKQRYSLIARRDIYQGGLQQGFARHARAFAWAPISSPLGTKD